MLDFSLAGTAAIVTGGNRGIGRSIAIGLAEAGADVCIAARNVEAIESVVAELRALGVEASGVVTDMADLDALRRLVDETRGRYGRLDVLVNNAAFSPFNAPLQDVSPDDWDSVMNVNLRSCFFLSKFAREAMIDGAEGGSIINVSSIAGVRASPALGAYPVSKAGLIMLTRLCAREWGVDGIRVNCLVPGLVRTDTSEFLWENPDVIEHIAAQFPMRRIGQPDDFAGAAVFLASAASAYVTGTTLPIDGGHLS